MALEIAARSHTGQVRDHNEDMYLVADSIGRDNGLDIELPTGAPLLLAVADGMGGHADGEVASRRSLELLDEARRQEALPGEPADHPAFTETLVSIHHALLAEQDPDSSLKMGATIVGLWLPDGVRPCWFHAGDSRLYRLRDGILRLLTCDHTIVNQMIQRGQDPGNISRHMVTSCLGGGLNSPTVDSDHEEGPVQPGDTWMLCSDGLTDMVTDEGVAEALALSSASTSAEALVNAALEGGGKDNITVVVLRVTRD